jgi:AraC-like DNA-binding protein
MIKTVTPEERFKYTASRLGTAPVEFASDLADRLLAMSRYLQPFDEPALADESGYSLPQFRRHCLYTLGETGHSFVVRLRLERAACRLASTGQPLPRVGTAAGFKAREAFTRAFGCHFGCPPSEFRR